MSTLPTPVAPNAPITPIVRLDPTARVGLHAPVVRADAECRDRAISGRCPANSHPHAVLSSRYSVLAGSARRSHQQRLEAFGATEGVGKSRSPQPARALAHRVGSARSGTRCVSSRLSL